MAVVQSSGKKQSDNVDLSSTVTYNAASNFTAGNTVIITLAHYNGGNSGKRITSISVSGTAAVKDVEKSSGGNWFNAEIWRASNVTGGDSSVVVTGDAATGQYLTCGFEEWDNIASSPLDKTGTGGFTTSTAPSANTGTATTQADEVSYAAFVDGGQTSWTSSTPPTGYTETWEEPLGTIHVGGSGAYKVLSATGTETATFTTGASMQWGAVIATYKLSAGASTTRGAPFGGEGTAFNGGRTFMGIIR